MRPMNVSSTLDDTTTTAKSGHVAGRHCFTNAMRQKPRRLVGNFQRPMKLMRADTLLTRRHHVERLQCLIERDAHMFENRADLDGELLFAVATAPQTNANAFGRVGGYLR